MNTELNSKAVKVNDGKVWDSETPLWVGISKVTDNVNGRLATMSVTLDRDWLWARFSAKPSESYRTKLVAAGFIWSQKRQGWHAPVSELVCRRLQDFGAVSVTHQRVTGIPAKPVATLNRDSNLSLDVEPKAASHKERKVEKATRQEKQRLAKLEREAEKLEAAVKSEVATQVQPNPTVDLDELANKVAALVLSKIMSQLASQA